MRGANRAETGSPGSEIRRKVNGRIRSSAPLLAGPSWSQFADGSGVGEGMVLHFSQTCEGHFFAQLDLIRTLGDLHLIGWAVDALSALDRSTWNDLGGRAKCGLSGKKGDCAMDTKPRLGRGLTSLLGESPVEGARFNLPVEQIHANPYQPRKTFDEDEISHLSDSIKTHGVLQPLVVRASGAQYQLIAGERRLRQRANRRPPRGPGHGRQF